MLHKRGSWKLIIKTIFVNAPVLIHDFSELFNETKMSDSQEGSSNGHEQQIFHNLLEDVPRLVPFLCNRSHRNQSF